MGRGIIQEPVVLSETEFVPHELLHRKPQLESVSSNIRPVVEEGGERYVVMHGPPGTGKTTLAKYLVDEMGDHLSPFASAYVNCWRQYTRFEVLYTTVEQTGNYRMTHRHLVSADELVDKVAAIKRNRPLVVIVDEVDLLQESSVLYDLSGGNLGLIMICNEAEDLWDVDGRIQSRLSGKTTVRFPRYKHSEMLDILDKRRQVALRKDALPDDMLDRISDEAAGDARIGIRLMRIAAEHADNKDADQVSDHHVEYALDEADKEYRRKSLSKLNKDQRVLYELMDEKGKSTPGRLYQAYREAVEEPVSKRTMRRYVNKMEHYNLLETSGQTNDRTITISE